MHVVRKLEHIVEHWFGMHFAYLDADSVQSAVGNEHEAFFKHIHSDTDWGQGGVLMMAGPLGIERLMAAPIMLSTGEYVGCVIAWGYLTKKHDHPHAQKMHVLDAHQEKYCAELVGLVAQEIIMYQEEIMRRDKTIEMLSQELQMRHGYDGMIGKSQPMQELYGLLDKIQYAESTVLIQGENGTGKELIARAIHYHSPRKLQAFVTVNCSAFNENLLDSELFGHTRGSFTGAMRDKKGLFEAADKGTLFLDEIGDMALSMQVKLLRVLQNGTMTPVGSTEMKKVDVRVLAATNKDLKAMIEDGTFREDLYYRINVINLVVPPLRERREDIQMLLEFFLARGCEKKKLPKHQLSKKVLEKMLDYPWPGNIRELENEVERLLVLSGKDEKILPEMLSQRIRAFEESGSRQRRPLLPSNLKDALIELEKTMIREGLRRTNWNKSKLAKELGISRAGLIIKVEKYKLDKRNGARSEVA